MTLNAESDVFPTFQHDGMEFIHMLQGRVVYRHGDKLIRSKRATACSSMPDAPHGPEELVKLPARYLSVICYPQER